MAEKTKISVKEGDVVLLIGPPEAKVIDVPFIVTKLIDRESIRVTDRKGVNFRIHKTRIARVIETSDEEPTEQPVTKQAEKSSEVQKPKDKEPEARKERQMATDKKEKKKPAKKVAKKKEIELFDPKEWAQKNNAHTVLQKQCEFDHATHKLYSFVAVSKSFVYCVNAYRYPNNQLGGASGEAKYPLKGQRITQKITNKKDGKTTTRILKGSKTPEKVIEERKKKGFKVLFTTQEKPAKAEKPAPTPAPAAEPAAEPAETTA